MQRAYTQSVVKGIWGILLAAGESTRMGQPKALLPWEDEPLVRYQVQQLLQTPMERIVIVLGHRRDEIAALLPQDEKLEVVDNPSYDSGKVSSILAGTRRVPEGVSILILGVDQPRPHSLVRLTIEAHLGAENLITIAGYGGRRGHPVIFAPELYDELQRIDEKTQGLRAILQRYSAVVNVVETGSPLALVNLNTPEDYESAILLNSTNKALAGNQ
jgi:molybdenum cofactor cytidylyltransferase